MRAPAPVNRCSRRWGGSHTQHGAPLTGGHRASTAYLPEVPGNRLSAAEGRRTVSTEVRDRGRLAVPRDPTPCPPQGPRAQDMWGRAELALSPPEDQVLGTFREPETTGQGAPTPRAAAGRGAGCSEAGLCELPGEYTADLLRGLSLTCGQDQWR